MIGKSVLMLPGKNKVIVHLQNRFVQLFKKHPRPSVAHHSADCVVSPSFLLPAERHRHNLAGAEQLAICCRQQLTQLQLGTRSPSGTATSWPSVTDHATGRSTKRMRQNRRGTLVLPLGKTNWWLGCSYTPPGSSALAAAQVGLLHHRPALKVCSSPMIGSWLDAIRHS
jgi:hypothetical protein